VKNLSIAHFIDILTQFFGVLYIFNTICHSQLLNVIKLHRSRIFRYILVIISGKRSANMQHSLQAAPQASHDSVCLELI